MNNNFKNRLIPFFFTAILLSSCLSYKPYYAKKQANWETANSPDSLKLKYSVYLIGDVGNPDKDRQEPSLKLLQSQIYSNDTIKIKGSNIDTMVRSSSKKDVVIFLGDNIYNAGLPKPDDADRKEKERRIIEQMKVVKGFKGRAIFIPGNHDWNEWRPGGLEAVNRQEEFVENYLDSADVFLPSNGCAGPVELQLGNDLVVIVIDTQWWLHHFEKPMAPDNGCETGSRLDVIQAVRDIMLRNKGKNIVIAQHHPLFSNGQHGGYYSFSDYLFPLTLIRDNLFIPLPVIGAIYPLMRQYGVSPQDISNKDYQQLKRGLLSVLEEEKNVVIAAGHEHSLQFHKYNELNHIVSGSGSKIKGITTANNASFAAAEKGFAKLNYYDNGQCWVEFWTPVGDGSTGKVLYRTPLYAIAPKGNAELRQEALISYKDSVKVIAAGEQYSAKAVKSNFLGEHYREVWATPIKANYLDMSSFAGGLTPIKLGGGRQTTSLQMKGKDGNVYQFRSISKDPSAVLPDAFLRTFADEFIQDQISSSHPYGGLIVPDMAKAIGIYHVVPQLVYMPFTSSLGPYLQDVGGKLGTIEARPDDDVSDFKSFGNAAKAVSTTKMYQKITEDNDNMVDQEMLLKSRLFDILIGDWDRHEDQWRWAEFDAGDTTLYRPIARDHDQAFAKYDGIIPKLLSKMLPDIQSFELNIGTLTKISLAARNLDRNLLNKLSKSQWQSAAIEIQNKLTDQVIEAAVRKMPAEAFTISGQEIITKLKSRRAQLNKAADDYYDILANKVTIYGSDKKEFFQVFRKGDETQVTIHKINKDNKIDNMIYDRTFYPFETKEIIFYALDGKDSVLMEGNGSNTIKFRIIGGPGEDVIIDNSTSGRNLVYDSSTENNTIKPGNNTVMEVSDKYYVNNYDRNTFKYDKSGIIPYPDLNGDDGIFIGAGFSWKHYSFRKEPYSFEQKLVANAAPKTWAYNIKYDGTFYSLFSLNDDLLFNASYNNPKYILNYFGEGNSSAYVNDIDFYRVRSTNLSVNAFYQHRFTKVFKIGMGPGYESYRIARTENRFVNSSTFPESNSIDKPFNFGTIRTYADLDFVNDPLFPTSGVKWRTEANYFNEFEGDKSKFGQLKSIVSVYGTPNFNYPVTVALRFGGAMNIGKDYKFFQANSLGTNTYLRGFRNNRFTGDSYLFQNTELRFKINTLRNYLFSGNFGLFGFFDSGRVFSDVAEDNTWHYGYGPGLWMNFYNKITVSAGYGISKEDRVISLKAGLSF
ncbi:MAG TPA: metallophosphoesterase [Sphingobacteriaceae bacterium]|nr:metallophosphoesterase [Sphingobacteriaceae bacterium]